MIQIKKINKNNIGYLFLTSIENEIERCNTHMKNLSHKSESARTFTNITKEENFLAHINTERNPDIIYPHKVNKNFIKKNTKIFFAKDLHIKTKAKNAGFNIVKTPKEADVCVLKDTNIYKHTFGILFKQPNKERYLILRCNTNDVIEGHTLREVLLNTPFNKARENIDNTLQYIFADTSWLDYEYVGRSNLYTYNKSTEDYVKHALENGGVFSISFKVIMSMIHQGKEAITIDTINKTAEAFESKDFDVIQFAYNSLVNGYAIYKYPTVTLFLLSILEKKNVLTNKLKDFSVIKNSLKIDGKKNYNLLPKTPEEKEICLLLSKADIEKKIKDNIAHINTIYNNKIKITFNIEIAE